MIISSDSITISNINEVTEFIPYYILVNSSSSPPAKPTTYPPTGWSTTEPSYENGKTAYISWYTKYANGDFEFSDVSVLSTYTAANDARKVATNYLSSDNTGIMISNLSENPETPSTATDKNVFIDENSVDIRDGQTVLASFGEETFIGEANKSRLLINNSEIIGYNFDNLKMFELNFNGESDITQYFDGLYMSYQFEKDKADGDIQPFLPTSSVTGNYVYNRFKKDINLELPISVRYTIDSKPDYSEYGIGISVSCRGDSMQDFVNKTFVLNFLDGDGGQKIPIYFNHLYDVNNNALTVIIRAEREETETYDMIRITGSDMRYYRGTRPASFSLGNNNISNCPPYTCLIGNNLYSNSSYQLVLGSNNDLNSDASFIIADGSLNKGITTLEPNNFFTIYKNGNVETIGTIFIGSEERSDGSGRDVSIDALGSIKMDGSLIFDTNDLYVDDNTVSLLTGGAIDLNNGDIIRANGIYFSDKATKLAEAINWKNDDNQDPQLWDSIWANSGKLYFAPASGTAREVLHIGNYTSYVPDLWTTTGSKTFTNVRGFGNITNGSKSLEICVPWASANSGTYSISSLSLSCRYPIGGYGYARSGSSGNVYTSLTNGGAPFSIWDNNASVRTNEVDTITCGCFMKSYIYIRINFVYALCSNNTGTVMTNNTPISAILTFVINRS